MNSQNEQKQRQLRYLGGGTILLLIALGLVTVLYRRLRLVNQQLADNNQPFFTTKPAGEGTGLGYAIITKGHQGSLVVESQEGAGTTSIIQLPRL